MSATEIAPLRRKATALLKGAGAGHMIDTVADLHGN